MPPSALALPPTWLDIAAVADLDAADVTRVEVDGVGPVALLRHEGVLHATSDACPHAVASLAQGFRDGEWLICPTHFAEFHIVTGETRNAPAGCPRLRIFAAEERDGRVWIDTTARGD